MTAVSDAAALAAIGAAARELKLPTVRDQATRLAEIAAREHSTYLAYLAEVLPPNSTTAPPGAAPAASPKPASRASNGWPTSAPTRSSLARTARPPGSGATWTKATVVLLGDSRVRGAPVVAKGSESCRAPLTVP